jgi:hypothetical protein
MLVIAGLLLRAPDIGDREAALLGFASWIGIQSRYQLVGAGLASAVVLAVVMRRAVNRGSVFRRAAQGSAMALVLASPFYAMNYRAFRNPVWPLMITKHAAAENFANMMARYYTRSLTGGYAPSQVGVAFLELLSRPFVFPLSILVLVLMLVAVMSRRAETKIVGLFGALFFVAWLAMAPALYAKFVLLLVPVAALAAGFIVATWIERAPRGSSDSESFAR